MTDIIEPMITGITALINDMRSIAVISWHGYTVTLFGAAVALIIFEKVLSCIFAAFTRISAKGETTDD